MFIVKNLLALNDLFSSPNLGKKDFTVVDCISLYWRNVHCIQYIASPFPWLWRWLLHCYIFSNLDLNFKLFSLFRWNSVTAYHIGLEASHEMPNKDSIWRIRNVFSKDWTGWTIFSKSIIEIGHLNDVNYCVVWRTKSNFFKDMLGHRAS